MTDQKKIDEARKLFEEQEIAQGRSVEMTSCGEYLDGVVFFGWLNELDRIDAEYAQAQKAAEQCETMQRPKSECGCPDCGSSLIDCPETEPAPAQDEREAFEAHMRLGGYSNPEKHHDGSYVSSAMELWWQGWKARATRPAQTEQQPTLWARQCDLDEPDPAIFVAREQVEESGYVVPFYAAPIAQTDQQPVALPPFAAQVLEKLERVDECFSDGQGADIGREWFDVLTLLGLLKREQRSPALWSITQQGRDALAAPIAQAAPQSDCEWCAGAGKDHFGEKCGHCHAAPQPEQSELIKALEDIAAGEKTVWRDDHFEVENDMGIDYPGIAKAALDAYRAALSAQGQKP